VKRVLRALSEELAGVRPRLRLMTAVVELLPSGMFPRLRAAVYRRFGMSLGPKVVCFAPLRFGWYGEVYQNLRVGERCFFSHNVAIDATAAVTFGTGVSVGHDVSIVTASHDASDPSFRAGAVQPKPVAIGNGVWICAHAKLLPGVRIGDGAVIGAGAVVSRDVAPNTFVAGVPARLVRVLDDATRADVIAQAAEASRPSE
jgi:maltose O-acetyltransferase